MRKCRIINGRLKSASNHSNVESINSEHFFHKATGLGDKARK